MPTGLVSGGRFYTERETTVEAGATTTVFDFPRDATGGTIDQVPEGSAIAMSVRAVARDESDGNTNVYFYRFRLSRPSGGVLALGSAAGSLLEIEQDAPWALALTLPGGGDERLKLNATGDGANQTRWYVFAEWTAIHV